MDRLGSRGIPGENIAVGRTAVIVLFVLVILLFALCVWSVCFPTLGEIVFMALFLVALVMVVDG